MGMTTARRWMAGALTAAALVGGPAAPVAASPDTAPGATWRAPRAQTAAHDGSYLVWDGTQGDYLAWDDGVVTDEDGLRVRYDSLDQLTIENDAYGLEATLDPPEGERLTVGWYGNVRTRNDRENPDGELRLSQGGRGCNYSGVWWQIDELDEVDGVVEHIALRLGGRCETRYPLVRAELLWSVPPANALAPPTPTATFDGTTLTASWTPSTDSALTGYEVTLQREGLAVDRRETGPEASAASFPDLDPGVRYQVVVQSLSAEGEGARSAPTSSVVPGTAGADREDLALVEQGYRDLLGRPADPAGRAYWLERMAGGATRSDVLLALARTSEQRRRAVGRIFTQLQVREPTRDEIDAYAPWLVAPDGYDQISALVVGSPERVEHFARAQFGWDDGLYRDVVFRDAQPAETDAIEQALADRRGHRGAALDVLRTVEARGTLVDDIYVRLLGRTPDAAGRQFWVDRFVRGWPQERLVAALMASPEYQARALTR